MLQTWPRWETDKLSEDGAKGMELGSDLPEAAPSHYADAAESLDTNDFQRRPRTGEVAVPPVSAACSRDFVRLPAWFSVAGALEVLKHKGVAHVIVEELGRPAALIREDDLRNASPADLVSRWAQKSSGEVAPEDPAIHAMAVLNARGTDWLPVVSGALFMGIVTRAGIERLLHGDQAAG